MTAEPGSKQFSFVAQTNVMMYTKLRTLKTLAIVFMAGAAMNVSITQAQAIPKLEENYLRLPAKPQSIKFQWLGDSVNSQWEPHTAMLIPVKLPNCPRQFYMQFDLGAPSSLLYRNKLLAIQRNYPNAIQLNDSSKNMLNFSFKAGKMPVLATEIVVQQFDNSTINWKDKNAVEIIGTIGADLIDGKVAIIDYPKKTISLSDTVPLKLNKRVSLSGFLYARRSVLLPSKIKGKQTMLYFDTGSSMYELLTDKKTSQSLAAPLSELIQSKVRSWDKILIANSLASNERIEIAGVQIPLRYSTYMEGVSNAQVEQMMKMGIGGMTGNKLFLDYKLILDTKNKQFGLLPSR